MNVVYQLITEINDALDEMKAVDIVEINIQEISSIADLMIVASGNSNRHVKAIAETILEKTKKAGFTTVGVEGMQEAEWILLDFGDAIVHVMQPKTRSFYDLEKLWSARPIDNKTNDTEEQAPLSGSTSRE